MHNRNCYYLHILRIVGWTLCLVGSGRHSIVPATNGSQRVGGQPRGYSNIPRFSNKAHLLHVLFVKVVPGTTFTSWSKHHFVVIGKAEQQVRKPSHCGTKQQ